MQYVFQVIKEMKMGEQDKVTTAVDALFELIRDKKQITIPDAAKILKVNSKIVEQWALFLEEEGLVTINYGMSTPVVRYATPKSDFESSQGVRAGFERSIPELISDIKKSLSSKVGADIIQKKIEEISRVSKKTLDASSYSNVLDKISEIRESLQTLNDKSISKEEMRDAKEVITSGLDEISALTEEEIFDHVSKAKDDLKNQKIERNTSVYSSKSALDYGINDTSMQSDGFKKIVELLNLANSLSEKGDFEGAKKIFSEVARLKQKLPEMYIKNKVEVVDNILNLDRNMVENVKERALKEFLIKEKEIMVNLSQSKSFAQRNKITDAEKFLERASETFNSLPSGFIEKKAELQEKLLAIKKRLLRVKAEISLKKLEETTKQFSVIVNKIDQFLLQDRISEANECIALGKKLIDSLPDEFINEKKDFLEEIQKAAIKIDNTLEEKNKGKLSTGLEELSKQIALVEKALKVGETDVAVKGYVLASSQFKNLPEGFIKEKIPIQEKLLDLYSEINSIVVKRKIESFNKDFDFISQQIQKANEFVENGDLKSAQRVYQEVIGQYEGLPGGFLERKTILRLELLNLYDKIRQKYESMKESEFSSLFLLPK